MRALQINSRVFFVLPLHAFGIKKRRCATIACAAAFFVGASCAAGQPGEPAMDEQEEALVLKEQLFAFAPYVSMHNRLHFGKAQSATAAHELSQWTQMRETNEDAFGANATLKIAYRDYRSFLISTESHIVPVLMGFELPKPMHDPVQNPEAALAELYLWSSLEIARNKPIAAWTQTRDNECRKAYARIMPLLVRAANGQQTSDDAVRIRHWFSKESDQGVFLEAVNTSGKTLHNVTLHVRFETLDGTNAKHYYFIPDWPAESHGGTEHRYMLWLATDWREVGAAATTGATVTMLSDEIVVKGARFTLDDQIPTAADRILAQTHTLLDKKEKPTEVLRVLRRIEPKLLPYADRVDRLRSQRVQAKQLLDGEIERIDARLSTLRKRVSALKDVNRNRDTTPGTKHVNRTEMQKHTKEIKALTKERLEWKSGKR